MIASHVNRTCGTEEITPHLDAANLGQIAHTKGVFALRPYEPSARRVYQPAALP
jgi:hypothetical protein